VGGLQRGDGVLDPAVELPHHMAANVLVREFMRCGCDTLCMIDSDMVFPADTVRRLRDAPAGAGYDILSALFTVRRAPYAPVVLKNHLISDSNGIRWEHQAHPELITGDVAQVDATGPAFCLIRRSVFVHLSEYAPWWFDWGERGLGEDTNFSQRAIKAGCKIGVHTGVSIEHRGAVGFRWDADKQTTTTCEYHQIGELVKHK